jgi:molecular chaperone DnaK
VTPSAVLVGKNGRVMVGKKAYEARISQPGNVALNFKRVMGQSDRFIFDGVGEAWTPESLSTEVLKAMLEDAHRATGDVVNAAVVTVPADFSQLQCDATLRAAKQAGLERVILLQEPIAAAVAYGMRSEIQGKQWIVYDFGGGTFDAALVSTEEGRLVVIEHAGDNMCGGKDIDKAIVGKILMPRLQAKHHLPALESELSMKTKRALYKAAEEVKIELSSTETAIAAIFDAGDDLDGDAIEFEVEITRAELAALVLPLIDKTLALCRKLLERAGASAGEIAGIILVGGPTNMPALRERLAAELGLPLEYALDPMTVVSRGAAVYAWGMFAGQEATLPNPTPNAVNVQLIYEPVCGDLEALVCGRIDDQRVYELAFESESGHWSSGWRKLVGNSFEMMVSLLPNRTSTYVLRLRNADGVPLPCDRAVQIRQGLAPDSPLLPHSIGAEIVVQNEILQLDVLFARGTPLPATRTVTYRTHRTLLNGDTDDSLAFKLWEGEYSDPESNTWLGQLRIHACQIDRPIPKGAEVHITVAIDVSRSMEVEIHVPFLKQDFTGTVFVAEENQESALAGALSFEDMASRLYARIEQVRERTHKAGAPGLSAQLGTFEEQLNIAMAGIDDAALDPDEAKRLLANLRTIRGEVSEIERYVRENYGIKIARKLADEAWLRTEEVAISHGTDGHRAELHRLYRQLEEETAQSDMRGIEKTTDDVWSLWFGIVSRHGWYWRQRFDYLDDTGVEFTDRKRAAQCLAEGRLVYDLDDGMQLKSVVQTLWSLRPKRQDHMDSRHEKSGFRKR